MDFFAVAVVVAFRKLKILIFLSCEKKLKYFHLHSILLHLVVLSEVVAKTSPFLNICEKFSFKLIEFFVVRFSAFVSCLQIF
jgi:hypothetical protein